MKTERQSPPTSEMEQAADWYWQIRDPHVSDETIAAWQAWLHATGQNRTAFSSIEATLHKVDQARELPWPAEEEILNDAYDGSMSVAEWRAGKQSSLSMEARDRFRVKAGHWAIAACVLMMIAGGMLIAWLDTGGASQIPPDFALYTTPAAVHREVRLPDGSIVSLGARSTISTAYTPGSRFVVLKRGTAFFDIAKDASRPFIVEAGNRRITAVGTAFNVTRQIDRVVVTVTEGTVIVSPDLEKVSTSFKRDDSAGSNVVGIARLEAGQQLAYNDEKMTPVTIADPADAIAWREGRLKYRGELLRYVIDDVQRYTKRPVVLADEAAGELSFTGTVFEQRIDSWLSGLEQVFPVEVEETPESIIIRYQPRQGSIEEM